jgi:osmotically-inducible protein OsmY
MISLRSDDAIRDEVAQEIAWDSHVDAGTIEVAVSNRIVVLTGSASTYAGKVAAQKAAHRVPGVLDVVNDLVVPAPDGSDERDAELAAAVRHALQWDVRVPDERISSTVVRGCVMLEGTVRLLREREDAAKAVRALRGVCAVTNRIVVEPHAVESAEIRTAIAGALARHARHEAKRIAVAVDEGVVTLSGPVDSFAEKQALLGLVGHLPGVRAVRDQLMLPA